MRNKFIHAYGDVDAAIVLDAVEPGLSELEEKIVKIRARA